LELQLSKGIETTMLAIKNNEAALPDLTSGWTEQISTGFK
jgi:hypothetical protein